MMNSFENLLYIGFNNGLILKLTIKGLQINQKWLNFNID